jgi:hypothetical protein
MRIGVRHAHNLDLAVSLRQTLERSSSVPVASVRFPQGFLGSSERTQEEIDDG